MSYVATVTVVECPDCGDKHIHTTAARTPQCEYPGCRDYRINGGPACRRHSTWRGRREITRARERAADAGLSILDTKELTQ